MVQQSKRVPARQRVPEQSDLFTDNASSIDDIPAWSGLPPETQTALTALIMRLILDHADKSRIASMKGADRDH